MSGESAKAVENAQLSSSGAQLADVISKIGHEGFDDTLLDHIATYCAFDSAVVLSYFSHKRPALRIDRLINTERTNTAQSYINGAYLIDPFYQKSLTINEPHFLALSEVTSDAFDSSEYFRSYYKRSGVIDEINYLVPLANGRVYAASVERSAVSGPFSAQDLEAARQTLPVVAQLVLKHISITDSAGVSDGPDEEHARLEARLRAFGSDVLTARECEVVQLMLNGYAMIAIGELLGVSVETARVHRRNIYAKLQISSLAELFSLALKAIQAQPS